MMQLITFNLGFNEPKQYYTDDINEMVMTEQKLIKVQSELEIKRG